MNHATKNVCGAKTKSGKPCQSSPIGGKRRCRLHGGATPRGTHRGERNGNYRHGIYSRKLSEEEQALMPTIPVGTLDDEIRLARLMLRRQMETHDAIQAAPMDAKNKAGFTVAEITVTTPDGTTSTMRMPDVYPLIDRLLGRLARLELLRSRLIAARREREGGGEWQPLPWVDWIAPETPPESR